MTNDAANAALDTLISAEEQAIAKDEAAIRERKQFLATLLARRNGAASPRELTKKARGGVLKKGVNRGTGLALTTVATLGALGGKSVPASRIVERMEADGFVFSAATPKDVLVRAVLRRLAKSGGVKMVKDPKSKRVVWSAAREG